MTRILLFLVVLSAVFGCNNSAKLPEVLEGEWVEYNPRVRVYEGGTVDRRFGSIKLEAFRIFSDSIDFYNGIFNKKGENRGVPIVEYCGNLVPYKYSHDSIYIKTCQSGNWELYAKVEKVTADSLNLYYPFNKLYPNNHSKRNLYLRPKPPKISAEQFDEIVFSYNAWTTANRVAIKRTGEVWLSIAPKIITRLQLSRKSTENIFSKFNSDLPKGSNIGYGLDAIDGSKTWVILLKNGKIIKTILDENEGSPDRLYWAFTPVKGLILNNYKQTKPSERLRGLILTDLEFRTDKRVMELSGAEIFLLWKELYKAQKTTRSFVPNYRLTSTWGYSLLLNIIGDQEQTINIDSAKTDGRFYRFYLTNAENITYDLGYDFVKRNLAGHKYDLQTYQEYLEMSKPIVCDSCPE